MTHSRIYTRTGDGGTSALFTGVRAKKSDPVFDALGSLDETSAAVGLARAHLATIVATGGNGSSGAAALSAELAGVQSRLLDAGSAVATPPAGASAAAAARAAFPPGATAALEADIDALDAALPPLKNFILPGGGAAAAALHLARTICRRAERAVVAVVAAGEAQPAVAVYINRLSDYLFVAARTAAKLAGEEEAVYKKAR